MEYTNIPDIAREDMLHRQGALLIPAIAYGDAAGLPVETRSAAYIKNKYDGGIQTLIPTKENPFYGSTEQPGMWSDDTQLSLAVAKALIDARGFSLRALAETHLEAYDDTVEIMRNGKLKKRGWGGSTTAAMEKLHAGEDPRDTGTPNGAGNGILMKMAPLVYWQVARHTNPDEIYEQLDELTNMTHASRLAELTTRVHGDVLNYLLTHRYDKEVFLAMLDDSIGQHEFTTRQPGMLRDLLSYLHGSLNQETILAHTDGRGFISTQTLAMAYGAFMAHQGEFTASVYEAVNLGGDTDSIASIVGAMSAFSTKESLILPADHEKIEQIDYLRSVSLKLANAALRR